MALRILVVAVVLLTGCAGLQPVPVTVPENQRVENEALPEDAGYVKSPFTGGEWSRPMDEEECIKSDGTVFAGALSPCPGKGGVLMSEELSFRFATYRTYYKQLRLNYEADRKVWTAQRFLYETRLKDAGEAIQRQRPNWFQQHAFELGILAGVVVGAGAAVGIVYGVAPAFKQQTTTP